MSLPLRMTLVRHGESEANIIQNAQERNEKFYLEEEINSRVDWKQRLSEKGTEEVKKAKDFLNKEYGGLDFFDIHYVSPFIRTRETAVLLSGDKEYNWEIDDRLSERIWGIYGAVSRQEQRSRFPLTAKLANDSPWYIRYDGGESLFDVYNRFKSFKTKLWRNHSDQNVLIVSHRQLIQTVCYNIEKMLPEDWDRIQDNQIYLLPNAGVMEYSRINPNDAGDVRDYFAWRRVTHPNSDHSPMDGEWVEFSVQKYYSVNELRGQVDDYPTIIE